ncbi:MAG TPA: cellulase family glycosylhydrolase [Tepidisphaeraceae bacterium]
MKQWAFLNVLFLQFICAIAAADPLALTGVNLAGGDFYVPRQGVRGIYNRDFWYPNAAEMDYFIGKGVNFVRIPFMWETLQPELSKPFLSDEMQRYKAVVTLATSKGLAVLIDPHNYARHYGKIVGGAEVSDADFADFWKRLSGEFADDPRVFFGLVNEPHDMPTKQWYQAANAAIAAIRASGAKNLIFVPGNAYTGAFSWNAKWYGEPNAQWMPSVKDPLNYWVIEVHQYFDDNSSGTKPTVVSATIGAERLRGFVAWARAHKMRAVLGEFGTAASGDPNNEKTIEDMLSGMERDRDVWLGWTWWAAGPHWAEYMYTMEPKNGKDRPQMAWIAPRLHGATMPKFSLSIKNGSGAGDVTAGEKHEIAAAPPAGMKFQKWIGDIAWLADPASATTTITMPFKDVDLEAVFSK